MTGTSNKNKNKNAELRPLRFITAASLFDGHDAAINIMRRLIQAQGVEVIHLGHNRSVEDIVKAALQEDADAIAISSYQGGHIEFFKYLYDKLKESGANHIRIFGGGGGTITPEEIQTLHEYGIERIYHPQDGLKMGLIDMIEDVIQRTRNNQTAIELINIAPDLNISRTLSQLENNHFTEQELTQLRKEWHTQSQSPVLGITGTGGAGKSSLTDELLNRISETFPNKKVAMLAVDPSRRRTGGALLGDRIRMNSLRSNNIFMRSMATRRQNLATNEVLNDAISFLKAQKYDLVIVETAGIGQSDSAIIDLVDVSAYVMTSDYGAASQLEKIDMLDFADVIVINKFEKKGAQDALRDVRKQYRRNHNEFSVPDEALPVFPTIASQFNDPGINWLFANIVELLANQVPIENSNNNNTWALGSKPLQQLPKGNALIPSEKIRYLAEIADQGAAINASINQKAKAAHLAQQYYGSLKLLEDPELPHPLVPYSASQVKDDSIEPAIIKLRSGYQEAIACLSLEEKSTIQHWPKTQQSVINPEYSYQVRGKSIVGENYHTSLAGNPIPKVAAPNYRDWGEILTFISKENLPGYYPFTAGVYPYRRSGEDPTRMFAGEGTPERTNKRFHYIAQGQPAARLSTAFDSVTLYGNDPDEQPDIYGKVGNSGVSIATLDDMKKLYSGFDLCLPTTSVSMTINGPAPIILAFFMVAAIDQQVEKYISDQGLWPEMENKIKAIFKEAPQPTYQGDIPASNNGLGLKLLGITGDQLLATEVYNEIKVKTLKQLRGTVQADILKEDQAQNTCIFSTEFAMHMMGDIEQFFVDHQIKNFYSVSISGYHIAEAGANPITQLAFTLANGFTIVEYYLARGMHIDEFAPNLSFFFSNGMDPEYTVIGRVARRIWAKAMKERYDASDSAQKLKYHIQTSGRSLHAQEIQFNDIRTTLQALYALVDNCNSLHTNAFDEAITTPTESSVRRAVAIQLIINKELGLNYCENPWQGSFFITQLTDLVEEAVYQEFKSISDRGGVLGAIDTMYQRSKIQDESMLYEHKKHEGSLPLVGVNTFQSKDETNTTDTIELMRSSETEKQQQVSELNKFKNRHKTQSASRLNQLKAVARSRENTFECLMETVKHCTLGEITQALYQVGGEYRRNM
ncbi:methylmalonyl-CoA mutase family protein [Litoribacillus peritrichatus]|uniref:Fused isobutyryl-CoA mutase n=1 Tax=Litoribacillus peritrichatus TaxID=718191 RepID=A0ABP7N2B7_9GAMM